MMYDVMGLFPGCAGLQDRLIELLVTSRGFKSLGGSGASRKKIKIW